ncbi:O-methyltransferase 1, chloroplastic isoform X2 [Cornus florida]|uniref:O-methyltransferase 1, chloroplastic isoform X2 n=1 Tax=Cornus florida TaxID=4283 RepID=UPI00289AFCAA|nr:O-methyltransferase 1, chloroplastic isoform X2 [Cornus florida]
MECLAGFAPPLAAATMRPSLTCAFKKTKNGGLRAKLNDVDEDPLYQSALYRASLRFQETHLSEPLFVDAYAGCFLPSNIETDMKHRLHHYCLATKFIDDKLLSTMNNIDGVKQVVLLTDGMDTRPYRLSWPTSTLIFDISPESVFRRAAQKLDDVGAKIPRSCLLLHAPLETSNIQETLCSKGFSGNRPSIWAFQCSKEWMDRLFMSNGFRVDMIGYDEVARNLGKEPASGDYKNILFVAEHLRFSDNQMETWRREFQRVEEEGDEEGFEEL